MLVNFTALLELPTFDWAIATLAFSTFSALVSAVVNAPEPLIVFPVIKVTLDDENSEFKYLSFLSSKLESTSIWRFTFVDLVVI